jgi:hypothetical protein
MLDSLISVRGGETVVEHDSGLALVGSTITTAGEAAQRHH